jgi:hypothetical protein
MASHKNYRAIFRFSLDGDTGSNVRNGVIKKLEGIGFSNTATGIWETRSSSIADIRNSLCEIMNELAGFSLDDDSDCILDHVWFYIDRDRS